MFSIPSPRLSRHFLGAVLLMLLALAAWPALAQNASQEAAIRKAVSANLPSLPPIDEIRETPFKGLYEVRMGTDVLYTDATGSYLLQGELVDLKNKRNLTQERLAALSAIDVAKLPLQDAFVTKRGKGERRLVVFADPNCGYCKRFEAEMAKVDNVTIHTFLYPILGRDSVEKSRNIWCAKDPSQVWEDWMLRGKAIPKASCSGDREATLRRNVEFGQKHKIEGTPTLLFANGQRVPGALDAKQIERLLDSAGKSS